MNLFTKRKIIILTKIFITCLVNILYFPITYVQLTERTINNDLLKYLAKLQMDDEPGIRTNTTICLGKISKHLNDSVSNKQKKNILL